MTFDYLSNNLVKTTLKYSRFFEKEICWSKKCEYLAFLQMADNQRKTFCSQSKRLENGLFLPQKALFFDL